MRSWIRCLINHKVLNACLALFSVFVTFIVLEIAIRIYGHEFNFHNFLELRRDLFRSTYPSQFDKDLGWIPKKGNHQKNEWNTRVTIGENGIRSNGKDTQQEKPTTILAVGDSFTFGDQVSDDETWPARLEELSNARVINGGVFGYGIDQSFLRMQALASIYRPDIIIFSFSPNDIYRCELSERTSVPKPYFQLSAGNELVLMNEHLRSYTPSTKSLGLLRGVLGYSFLVHSVMMSRKNREYWLQGSWKSTQVHTDGARIACRIFDRLNRYAQEEKVALYILIQYGEHEHERDLAVVDEVIPCLEKSGLKLIDLRYPLASVKEHDIQKYKSLFDVHMTREGNYFVASTLWDATAPKLLRPPIRH